MSESQSAVSNKLQLQQLWNDVGVSTKQLIEQIEPLACFVPLLGDGNYEVAGRPFVGVTMHNECIRDAESADDFVALINRQYTTVSFWLPSAVNTWKHRHAGVDGGEIKDDRLMP